MMANPRWKQRPEGATWGDFGPDDQLGRVNLLREEQVLKGAREIVAGRTFCLSLPLDLPGGNVLNPRRHPPMLSPTRQGETPYVNFAMSRIDADAVDILSDDQVLLCTQYSTQWDSLAHVGAWFDADGEGKPERCYYNGYRAGIDVIGPSDDADDGCGCHAGGASAAYRLGIDTLARHGMQGRGVLVDLQRIFGNGRTLVGFREWTHALQQNDVVVEPGDMLVLRTGFAEVLLEMNGQPDADALHQCGAVLDGSDPQLLQWITDSGIAAICADNYAVEAYPSKATTGKRSLLPLHHHCLFKLGLPLAELWHVRELAEWLHANRRCRFMLTAPPLHLPNAMGSPVTPIATV